MFSLFVLGMRKAGVFIGRIEGTGGGVDREILEREKAERRGLGETGKARHSSRSVG